MIRRGKDSEKLGRSSESNQARDFVSSTTVDIHVQGASSFLTFETSMRIFKAQNVVLDVLIVPSHNRR